MYPHTESNRTYVELITSTCSDHTCVCLGYSHIHLNDAEFVYTELELSMAATDDESKNPVYHPMTTASDESKHSSFLQN